jgi:hypothetical protein
MSNKPRLPKEKYAPRPILVFCETCQEWVNENEVKVLDIFEDAFGCDVLTFEHCFGECKSLRVGG